MSAFVFAWPAMKRGARLRVGGERVGLPARAVEREHQLGAQSFPQRLLGDERLQRAISGCAQASYSSPASGGPRQRGAQRPRGLSVALPASAIE